MIDLRTTDTFEFFVPAVLAKGGDSAGPSKDNRRWIQGIASTDDVDLQGETVVQNGIDTTYFLKYGYINDDHKPGPEHKVGEPTEARATKAGLWIKAFLYRGDGTERCDYWWQHLERLERSDAKRSVGFSIQGKITRRAGNSILKCWLQDIAITASPVNTNTWAEVVKSLAAERFCVHPWRPIEKACKGCPGAGAACTVEADELKALGTSNGAALRVQSLEGSAKIQTYKSLPDVVDKQAAVSFLQNEKGYSAANARAVADALFTNHGAL